MELNFHWKRLIILAIALVAGAALGIFTPLSASVDPAAISSRLNKAWVYTLILYLLGAGNVSLVDHFTGTVDRTNLRPGYIVLGILAMIAALLWRNSLVEGLTA